MRLDYKHLAQTVRTARPVASKRQAPYALIFGITGLFGALIVTVVLLSSQRSNDTNSKSSPIIRNTANIQPTINNKAKLLANTENAFEYYQLALPALQATTNSNDSTASNNSWQSFVIKSGHSLAVVGSHAGVKSSDIHALMQLGDIVAPLSSLYPGEEIRLRVADGNLTALEYDIDLSKRLSITRNNPSTNDAPSFDAQIIQRPLEIRNAYASGVIEQSLFLAGRSAGLSDRLTMELANVFGWDIDFSQEVREGDHFTVVYEQQFRAGERINDGNIIAAEFVNRGVTYQALRFTAPDGHTDYYTADGKSVRKAFLRNPIDLAYARISSRFSLGRMHPILHKMRAHHGVDYAASTGTPIKATGDGKIIFHGVKGGYGNVLVVQHGQQFNTLYAHLSKFARDTKVGARIRQGQTIGYVGKTGLATGPHLHFEFRVNGVHRDPLTFKHAGGQAVAEQYRSQFTQTATELLAQLNTVRSTSVASK
ncbi:MAG: peptidoglycan DD-metalloendopeptidase family protein [Gammaproteobacteria bacterium]|nr:peptidoglycan DD-metalloendopeptidase family protein [Gammaproteobacteria bacterium]